MIVATTQKGIKDLERDPGVVNLTHATINELNEIRIQDHYFRTLVISKGKDGINGIVLQGLKSLKLYVMTDTKKINKFLKEVL